MSSPPRSCGACGAAWSLYDRVCDCGALVHAEELVALRTRARIGRMAKDPDMATRALRRALQLVPEEHPEHAALQAELDATLNPPRQLTPMRRVSETGVTGGVLSDVKARWRRVFGKAE